ncbi:MAG TPA: ATP-binding protein [Opitutaceae bacterium]
MSPRRASKRPTPRRRTPGAGLLAAALRDLSEGVFIAERRLGRDGLRIVWVNEAFCAATGYAAGELIGRGHAFLHTAPNDLVALRRWSRRLRPGAAPLMGEGYLHHRNGSTPYAAWTLSAVCDRRGRISCLVATYRDMTEKRQLQEALLHSQRLDAVGRLAGGVAHDFNNLLSVINGYCEILTTTVAGNAKALKELTEIHEAGQKATTLVRQLLAFSRRQEMSPQVIDLNRLVRDNAEILARLLKPDKTLELSLDESLDNVRADGAHLQQVLLNLTINARDALSPGGRVTIRTAMREAKAGLNRRLTDLPPGWYVVLTVADNGHGMDAQTQAHLFEPFFTTKEPGQGTGLGLALVYGVVQQNGGFITVQSAPDAGSTFEIFLPRVQEAAVDPHVTLPSLPATGGRETVLIIEADDVVRKMVAGILTADGYKVVAAATPLEGLAAVRRHAKRVQLVCLGVNDRPHEAEQLVRALLGEEPGLRLLATPDEAYTPYSWLPAAAQAALPKPFALSAVLKAVRALLDAPAAD